MVMSDLCVSLSIVGEQGMESVYVLIIKPILSYSSPCILGRSYTVNIDDTLSNHIPYTTAPAS